MILEISEQHPKPRRIAEVVDILKGGGVIAYPTDTVYALGCDIFCKSAIERIYRIKGRSKHKPLSFICHDLSEANRYGKIDNSAFKIMKRLLPGPYTFILPATRLVPKIMLTRRHTVGIRVPDCRIATAIVEGLGNPIVTSSLTIEEDELVGHPRAIHDSLDHQIDLVVDAGALKVAPSSVIDLTDEAPVVVRAGKGDVSMFE